MHHNVEAMPGSMCIEGECFRSDEILCINNAIDNLDKRTLVIKALIPNMKSEKLEDKEIGKTYFRNNNLKNEKHNVLCDYSICEV